MKSNKQPPFDLDDIITFKDSSKVRALGQLQNIGVKYTVTGFNKLPKAELYQIMFIPAEPTVTYCGTFACFTEDCLELWEPKTIRLGKYDVPEPLKERPKDGTIYYIPDPCSTDTLFKKYIWNISYEAPKIWLKRGLVHLTEEAAELHAKALLSFTTTEINDAN